MLTKLGEDTEQEMRGPVAAALINKGNALCELKRWEKAVSVYQTVIEEYKDASSEEQLDRVLQAQKQPNRTQIPKNESAQPQYFSFDSSAVAIWLWPWDGTTRTLIQKNTLFPNRFYMII